MSVWDTNSSVEYTLNRFDQVLDVRPLEEESADLARALREHVPKFTHIDRAMVDTVDAMYRDGSLTGEQDDQMVVTISSKEERKGPCAQRASGQSPEHRTAGWQTAAAVHRGPDA